jgi:hypothetical protein
MRLLLVSALLAPLVTGCGPAMSMATTHAVPRAIALGQLPREGLCQDGLPVRILAGPTCVNGICGYSCLPDRWHGESPDYTQR